MERFPNDVFLEEFFAYFTGDAICPHREAVMYKNELSEKGDVYVVCPY